jgi:hypothetical protein
MTWVIENLSPAPNGTIVDFTISHAPITESMMVIHNAIRQVRVAVTPNSGEAEYGVSGTAVKMGIAPATGADCWTRYFY